MSNKKNILLFEMVNEGLKVHIEGNTDDLSSMIASAIIQDENIDKVFRAAMLKVVMGLNDENESEDDYVEQLIRNGVTAQA
jgi:hypothetical protein